MQKREADHITIGNFRNDEANEIGQDQYYNSQPMVIIISMKSTCIKSTSITSLKSLDLYDTTEMIHNEIELKTSLLILTKYNYCRLLSRIE